MNNITELLVCEVIDLVNIIAGLGNFKDRRNEPIQLDVEIYEELLRECGLIGLRN